MASDDIKTILWQAILSDNFSFEYTYLCAPYRSRWKSLEECIAEELAIYDRKPEKNFARVYKRKNADGIVERAFTAPERQPTYWGFHVVIGDGDDLVIEWRFHDGENRTGDSFPPIVGHRVHTFIRDGERVFESEGYDRSFFQMGYQPSSGPYIDVLPRFSAIIL